MSNIQDLISGEAPEGRSDAMLEMIYSLIQEANEMHAGMLVASANSDQAVFDEYNKLSARFQHTLQVLEPLANAGSSAPGNQWTQQGEDDSPAQVNLDKDSEARSIDHRLQQIGPLK